MRLLLLLSILFSAYEIDWVCSQQCTGDILSFGNEVICDDDRRSYHNWTIYPTTIERYGRCVPYNMKLLQEGGGYIDRIRCICSPFGTYMTFPPYVLREDPFYESPTINDTCATRREKCTNESAAMPISIEHLEMEKALLGYFDNIASENRLFKINYTCSNASVCGNDALKSDLCYNAETKSLIQVNDSDSCHQFYNIENHIATTMETIQAWTHIETRQKEEL